MRWQKVRSTRPWECEICGGQVTWPSADHAVLLDLLAVERQRGTKHRGAVERRREAPQQQRHWGVFKRAFAEFAVLASVFAVGAALSSAPEASSRRVRGGAPASPSPRLGPRIPFFGSSRWLTPAR